MTVIYFTDLHMCAPTIDVAILPKNVDYSFNFESGIIYVTNHTDKKKFQLKMDVIDYE